MAKSSKSDASGSSTLTVLIGVACVVLLSGCVGIGVLGWVLRAHLGFGEALAKDGARPGPDIKADDPIVAGKPGEKIVTDADTFAKKLLTANRQEWDQLVGRLFELTGTVHMVGPGYFYIDGVQGIRFLCRPAPEFADKAARLTGGQRVKVEGKCVAARAPDVQLNSCTITVLDPPK